EFCDINICAGKSALKYDKLQKIKTNTARLAAVNQKLTFALQWLPSDGLLFIPLKLDKTEDKIMFGTGEHKQLEKGETIYHCLVDETKEGLTYFAARADYSDKLGWSIELCYEHQNLLEKGEFTRHNICSVPLSILLDNRLYNNLGGDKLLEKLGLEVEHGGVDDPIWYHDHEEGVSFSLDFQA
ncbi:hypothetical protein FWG76_01790, partial [Candidatus Saccharibacteria bacterium]|nr:hypothetical protein [Candidatus Saccharibacteria bacterium]